MRRSRTPLSCRRASGGRRYAAVFICALSNSPTRPMGRLHPLSCAIKAGLLAPQFGGHTPMDRTINIVTDGSAIGNPGPGGWGAVFTCGRQQWKLSGASQRTTAAEMALTAALEALKLFEPCSAVTLSSDCEYLIQ